MRVARPAGMTRMCQALNRGDEPERHKKEILKIAIAHYVNNGFTYCNKVTSINELSIFLNTSTVQIMKTISRYSSTLASVATPENVNATLQALTGLVVQNAMTDRAKVSKQTDDLLKSQGAEYKAFITKEVNASLKNLMESNKSLVDIIKAIQGPSSNYVQNNFNDVPDNETVESIGVNEAVALINQEDPESLLTSADKQKGLLKLELGQEPIEVVATRQDNFVLQGSIAIEQEKEPIIKGTHTERNEDNGEIVDATYEEIDE